MTHKFKYLRLFF